MTTITIASGVRLLKDRTTPIRLPHSGRIVDDTAPNILVIEGEDGPEFYRATEPGSWQYLSPDDMKFRDEVEALRAELERVL